MKLRTITVLSTLSILATGCASSDFKQIPYGCDSEESDPFCADVSTIVDNAIANEDRNINVLKSDNEIKDSRSLNTIQSQKTFNSNNSGSATLEVTEVDYKLNSPTQNSVGTVALEGRPLYVPEKVHRLYRGPWMDDYQIMHGGEHLFYKTPGRWTFGNMKEPGSASGLIEPVMPADLGFERGADTTNGTEIRKIGRHMVEQNQSSSSISKPSIKKMN